MKQHSFLGNYCKQTGSRGNSSRAKVELLLEKVLACALVNYEVCELAMAL
jgi:hypothetical protein